MNTSPKGLQWTVILMTCASLSGCSTDQQKTKTEGTVIGAGIGAVLGAALVGGLTAATGGSKEQIKNAVIAGGVAGAVVGGARGYQWGKAVARRKEEFTKTEDYVNASIGDAKSLRQAATVENARLKKVVAEATSQQAKLKAAFAQGQISQKELAEQQRGYDKEIAAASSKAANLGEGIANQKIARKSAGQETSIATKNSLDEEIALLEQQKSALDGNIRSLKAVSGGKATRGAPPYARSGSTVSDGNGTVYLDTPKS